jgi:adenylate kinase
MNILFVGKPGSGKGTITQNLLDDGFLQLSTGDLLRKEAKTGSDLAAEINERLAQGKFASDETIFKVVEKFLKENEGKSIIFDGFPRNVEQARHCLEKGLVFDQIFEIDVSDDLVKERIVNRRIHQPSGRVYNIKTMPPKVEGLDDVTGEPLTHRHDDKLEVLDNRLADYQNLTAPVIDFLKTNGFTVIRIDGSNELDNQLSQVKSSLNNDLADNAHHTKKNKP